MPPRGPTVYIPSGQRAVMPFQRAGEGRLADGQSADVGVVGGVVGPAGDSGVFGRR
jgi:hypothetical protein